MTVFKAFFRVSKRFIIPVALYMAIMVVMSIMVSNAMGTGRDDLQVSTRDYRIAILNDDGDHPVSRGLEEFLAARSNRIDLGSAEKEIRDALFWQDVFLVLRIPAGFGEQVLEGKNPQVESFNAANDYVHLYIDAYVNRFLGTVSTYHSLRPRMTAEQIVAQANQDLQDNVQITQVKSGMLSAGEEGMAIYLRFVSYSLMAAVSSGMGMVLAVMVQKKLAFRNRAASLSETSRTAQLAGASLLYSSIIWLVLVGFGVFNARISLSELFSQRILLMLGGSYLYLAVCMAVALLATSFTQNTSVVTGVSNVISLGSSFLGGVFVPLELLGPGVQAMGKALPAYWYTAGIRLLTDSAELSGDVIGQYGRYMGIVALMTAVLLTASLLVNKFRRQQGI
ncbi:MAG: ABC transporter permease [Clostridiales bacterium]|nr:ABC transporter permease [Clostridiales bacterium]